MSFLGKMLGGKKKGDKAVSAPAAIQQLRDVEEMLVKKQEYLESKVKQEMGIAKKNATRNKPIALRALKRKKRFEKQLQQIDGTLSTIEMQREALENASTNTEVLNVMGVASKVLSKTHKDIDIDKLQDMMEDMAAAQEDATEIANVIANPLSFGDDVDEDELTRELEELENEELTEGLLRVGPVHDLPVPPKAEPAAKVKPKKAKALEDDDDMKELAMWAS